MTSDDILDLVVQALIGRTAAGTRVYSPRRLPTTDAMTFPLLMCDCDVESGSSVSGSVGYPAFNVETTVRIIGRAQALAAGDDDGSAQLSAALGALRDQIKAAVINGPDLMAPLGPVQAFSRFTSRKQYGETEDRLHNGDVVVEIGVQHYQSGADFFVDAGVALKQVRAIVDMPSGTAEPGVDITGLDS